MALNSLLLGWGYQRSLCGLLSIYLTHQPLSTWNDPVTPQLGLPVSWLSIMSTGLDAASTFVLVGVLFRNNTKKGAETENHLDSKGLEKSRSFFSGWNKVSGSMRRRLVHSPLRCCNLGLFRDTANTCLHRYPLECVSAGIPAAPCVLSAINQAAVSGILEQR